MRRTIRHVAAQGAAVLDLHTANLARGCDEHRQAFLHERRSPDVGEGRERADRQDVAAHLNPTQRVEGPEVQKSRVLERPEIQRHVQIGAARHRHERALVAQQAKRVGQ